MAMAAVADPVMLRVVPTKLSAVTVVAVRLPATAADPLRPR